MLGRLRLFLLVAALAGRVVVGDFAGLQHRARRRHAVGDLDLARKVLLAAGPCLVGQLSGEGVQRPGDLVVIPHIHAAVVGGKGDRRVCRRFADDRIARRVMAALAAVVRMRVVDERVAAVVVERQRVRILLDDARRILRVLAAREVFHDAACKFLSAEVGLRGLAPHLVRPRRAACHVEIRLAGEALCDLRCGKVVHDDAVQGRIRRAEPQIDDAVLERLGRIDGAVQHAEIAFDVYFVCTMAVPRRVHVHVRDTALRHDRKKGIGVVPLDLDGAASRNSYGRTAAIGKDAVAVNFQIHIA